MAIIDRFRSLVSKAAAASSSSFSYAQYTRLSPPPTLSNVDDFSPPAHDESVNEPPPSRIPAFEVMVYVFLGIVTLWSWNMLLAAASYFIARFAGSPWIIANYQACVTCVYMATNLTGVTILARTRAGLAYTQRVLIGLALNTVVAVVLALSTVMATTTTHQVYMACLLFVTFLAAAGTALLQNGSLAMASGLGGGLRLQALMTGQAVAGVLPPIAQLISILAVAGPSTSSMSIPSVDPTNTAQFSALLYFSSAILLYLAVLITFPSTARSYALARHQDHSTAFEEPTISLRTLLFSLPWHTAALILCFALTAFYPVTTGRTVSSHPSPIPPLLSPALFTAFAFLIWNSGDLLARIFVLIPQLVATGGPTLLVVAITRAIFPPIITLLCNFDDRAHALTIALDGGNKGPLLGDVPYLFVQLAYGTSNGWLTSCCFLGAVASVRPAEREAVGGFMGVNLVAGLLIGGVLSFGLG